MREELKQIRTAQASPVTQQALAARLALPKGVTPTMAISGAKIPVYKPYVQAPVAKVSPALSVVLPPVQEVKPVALSALAGIASAALGAATSPTGQALISGIGGALGFSTGGLGGVLGKAAGVPAVRKQYTVFRKEGRIVDLSTGKAIGYTPQAAKKRFKTKRRSRRLTQKDRYEWEMRLAIANVQAGHPALAPVR